MNTGRLRHRVTLQGKTLSHDAWGGTTETWGDIATVWASVDPVSGREYFAGEQFQSEVTIKVRIRFRSDVVPTMRIVNGLFVYQIEAILADNRDSILLLLCKDISNEQ